MIIIVNPFGWNVMNWDCYYKSHHDCVKQTIMSDFILSSIHLLTCLILEFDIEAVFNYLCRCGARLMGSYLVGPDGSNGIKGPTGSITTITITTITITIITITTTNNINNNIIIIIGRLVGSVWSWRKCPQILNSNSLLKPMFITYINDEIRPEIILHT